jgi:uncharacterized membrane protein
MKSLREFLATIGLLFTILTVSLSYSALPQRIPNHFDANGIVNGWGDKSFLWFLVGITCVVYLGMTLIRYAPPSSFSVPVSPELRGAAIPIALDMVAWLKAEMTWIFAAITWATVVVAQGRSRGMTEWFIPLAVGVVFATSLYYIVQMMRLKMPNADEEKSNGYRSSASDL